jgi:hypothetical protein
MRQGPDSGVAAAAPASRAAWAAWASRLGGNPSRHQGMGQGQAESLRGIQTLLENLVDSSARAC